MKKRFMIGPLSRLNFAIWSAKMDQSFGELYFKIFHTKKPKLLLTKNRLPLIHSCLSDSICAPKGFTAGQTRSNEAIEREYI